MVTLKKFGLGSTSNFNTIVSNKIKHYTKKEILISKIKRRILRHVWVLRLLIGLFIFISLFILFIVAFSLTRRSSLGTYFSYLYSFIFTPAGSIKEVDDRTNIIILGKGGGNHEAPDLTDTIILVSIPYQRNEIVTVSLPRDIWISELRAKLNSTYYWGNRKEEGGGLILSKSEIEKVSGVPIQYALIIDFEGFKKVINILGGIDVNVERGFVDEKFPIEGRENDGCNGDPEFRCRYKTIRFESGLQHMDGDTSLEFARSRNAQGDEGTDFSRAARQEKIVNAIKEKILSREIIFSPKKLFELKNALSEYVETDLNGNEGAVIARKIFIARKNIRSYVLPEELLINPPKSPQYDNLYVFIPKNGNWNGVHSWTYSILEIKN